MTQLSHEEAQRAAQLLIEAKDKLGEYILLTMRNSMHNDLDVASSITFVEAYRYALNRHREGIGEPGLDTQEPLLDVLTHMILTEQTPPKPTPSIRASNRRLHAFITGLREQIQAETAAATGPSRQAQEQ